MPSFIQFNSHSDRNQTTGLSPCSPPQHSASSSTGSSRWASRRRSAPGRPLRPRALTHTQTSHFTSAGFTPQTHTAAEERSYMLRQGGGLDKTLNELPFLYAIIMLKNRTYSKTGKTTPDCGLGCKRRIHVRMKNDWMPSCCGNCVTKAIMRASTIVTWCCVSISTRMSLKVSVGQTLHTRPLSECYHVTLTLWIKSLRVSEDWMSSFHVSNNISKEVSGARFNSSVLAKMMKSFSKCLWPVYQLLRETTGKSH